MSNEDVVRCAVANCSVRIRIGWLMCQYHWDRVTPRTRIEVERRWKSFMEGTGTLVAWREEAKRAIHEARSNATQSG